MEIKVIRERTSFRVENVLHFAARSYGEKIRKNQEKISLDYVRVRNKGIFASFLFGFFVFCIFVAKRPYWYMEYFCFHFLKSLSFQEFPINNTMTDKKHKISPKNSLLPFKSRPFVSEPTTHETTSGLSRFSPKIIPATIKQDEGLFEIFNNLVSQIVAGGNSISPVVYVM